MTYNPLSEKPVEFLEYQTSHVVDDFYKMLIGEHSKHQTLIGLEDLLKLYMYAYNYIVGLDLDMMRENCENKLAKFIFNDSGYITLDFGNVYHKMNQDEYTFVNRFIKHYNIQISNPEAYINYIAYSITKFNPYYKLYDYLPQLDQSKDTRTQIYELNLQYFTEYWNKHNSFIF